MPEGGGGRLVGQDLVGRSGVAGGAPAGRFVGGGELPTDFFGIGGVSGQIGGVSGRAGGRRGPAFGEQAGTSRRVIWLGSQGAGRAFLEALWRPWDPGDQGWRGRGGGRSRWNLVGPGEPSGAGRRVVSLLTCAGWRLASFRPGWVSRGGSWEAW